MLYIACTVAPYVTTVDLASTGTSTSRVKNRTSIDLSKLLGVDNKYSNKGRLESPVSPILTIQPIQPNVLNSEFSSISFSVTTACSSS